jgi:putative FmdB family regulatory protein
MPIYEYRCQSCGHEQEVIQKISDPALTDCPACNKPELTKKISAAGFRLKGGGWYETDFKSGGKKNVAGDTASSSSATAKTSTTASSSSDN